MISSLPSPHVPLSSLALSRLGLEKGHSVCSAWELPHKNGIGPSYSCSFHKYKNNFTLATNMGHSCEQCVGSSLAVKPPSCPVLCCWQLGNGAELGQPELRAHGHVGLGVQNRKLEGIF